jgi:cystathionine beta-lyase/cystathionine gamma-synthase
MAGFGGMVSFELDGTVDEVTRFVSQRTIVRARRESRRRQSLICHPARMTHASIPAERRAALGLSDSLDPALAGIEHPDDLIADLDRRLAGSSRKRSANSRTAQV